jgi:hypothetical protein
LKDELHRRHGYTQAIYDLFAARPGVWIEVDTLSKVGGFCAWRTRCSDARKRFEREGIGTIQWNSDIRASAYRLALAPPRIPSTPALQQGLFQ